MEYARIRVIGGGGPDKPLFDAALRDIVARPTGGLIVVGDSVIKLVDDAGRVERQWSTEHPGYCAAVDAKGTIWVGEPGQIETFNPKGERQATWRDPDRFGLVTAIGFAGEFVLIADAQDRCIRRFDASHKWLNDIGNDNNTKGFAIPNGYLDFNVDDKGIIHAISSGKHRIERYSLEGKMVGRFGHFGQRKPADFPGCCNPTNMTLSREGLTIVTEKAGPRMKVFDKSDKLLGFVGSDAFDENCKNMPVAVDARGQIYVGDTVKRVIVVFAPQPSESGKTTETKPTTTQGAGTP